MKARSATNKGTNRAKLSRAKQALSPQASFGLSRHYLATLVVTEPSKLLDVDSFTEALQPILLRENVQCLGEVNHEFPNKSFTSVVGLAESHISVHTWPEHLTVQLDVFLCNYVHDNRQKGERVFNAIVDYFEPIEVDSTTVDRR